MRDISFFFFFFCECGRDKFTSNLIYKRGKKDVYGEEARSRGEGRTIGPGFNLIWLRPTVTLTGGIFPINPLGIMLGIALVMKKSGLGIPIGFPLVIIILIKEEKNKLG